ncbi:AMP-binding protein [Rhizobacter sp. SG703]|uniref:acyl-CoA synthetase n=1 Tax=Rhizobacter sp. SG703 TaxID=2587140 RepID=UPI001447A8E5|nr:AMP-binding protein [Rhizobacter sp. SG703]NKI95463.1 acetyl-CoA synthetase [Rhizobacter sp. SG703]
MPDVDHYHSLYSSFRWQVPADFNIGEACCGRWARETPDAIAIRHEREDGTRRTCSYRQLQARSRRLAAALQRLGVRRGDRVAIVMAQRIETAVAHIALHQLGAVAMPLSVLFGPEALEFRLQDSEACIAIGDEASIGALRAVHPRCPSLASLVVVGAAAASPGEVAWDALLQQDEAGFVPVATRAADPAILIYTSGTTGPPKGALLPQRALVGNLSGFVASQNWFPRRDEVFWSPADWAWTGGLMDALLPTLCFGREIVAYQGRFGPEKAFELMARYGVTNAFLFPTALKAMMKAVPAPRGRYALRLRAVMSAGEAVGDAVFAWCREQLGITVNEMFGQTEINYVVGNCTEYLDADGRVQPGWPARPGSMGRAYPGHRVAVLDDAGHECPRGTPGDVAVHRRDVHGDLDPVFFAGYWRNDGATRAKFTGDPDDSWCRTGDTALMDDDGYLWYQGRSDDVFKVAGYRIGPGEIENCLVKHPSVVNAAVVPKPDPARGALVKAYVVLADGVVGDAALVGQLQAHVKGRLAPYEYPKEIEFIDALPMTTTGKVQRRVLRLQEEERAKQR